MTWLSIADAKKQGIDVEPVDSRRVADAPAATISAATVRSVPPPPAIDKVAIQQACSEQASARGLHGDDRREFRAECKKRLGM
jgi:psiF repeat